MPRSRRIALLTLTAAFAAVVGCGGDGGGSPPDAAPARFRVLVFTATTGFRHPSIPAGVALIRDLGRRHGFAVDHTEDPRRFAARGLARYDALIFLSSTGEPLPEAAQRRALRRYVEGGGGFLGIHAASDAFYGWRWYGGLVGAVFRRHAAGAPTAAVVVEDRRAAATRYLPRVWRRADEWYAFRTNPRRRAHVLAALDERTYDADGAAMGDHPIAWCHRYDGGRSVYTAMGHTTASYDEPLFAAHLLGAIRMAAGRAPFRCPPG
jgi:type 1 glutamine amidotransferase